MHNYIKMGTKFSLFRNSFFHNILGDGRRRRSLNPPHSFTESVDMGINRKSRYIELKNQNTGSCLWSDTWKRSKIVSYSFFIHFMHFFQAALTKTVNNILK